jgi:hypothetical protein
LNIRGRELPMIRSNLSTLTAAVVVAALSSFAATDGALAAEVVAAASNCTAIDVRFSVDGEPVLTSEGVAAGASTDVVDLGPVTPGGSDWSPVLIPTDPIIPRDYDSVLNWFTFAYAGYPFESEGRPAASEQWLLQRGLQRLTRAPFPDMPRA